MNIIGKKFIKHLIVVGIIIGVGVALWVIFVPILKRGTVEISTSHDPAHFFFVNNEGLKDTFESPKKLSLEPGFYTIYLYKEKFEPVQKSFEVIKNKNVELKLTLKPVEEERTEAETQMGSPIAKKLPHETEHFRIEYHSEDNSYFIVPKIPFTSSEAPQTEFEKNWNNYLAWGKEALQWLKEQNLNPDYISIIWWGEDWWPEGAKAPSL
jgi:hypothetical protein